MSWQEELRRLDAELAAGRLGHAEHRRQRDELLAEASGGGAASPVASPLRQDAPSPSGSPTWSSPVPQATSGSTDSTTGPDSQATPAPSSSAESSTPRAEPNASQTVATSTGQGPTTTRRSGPDSTTSPSAPSGTTSPSTPSGTTSPSTSPGTASPSAPSGGTSPGTTSPSAPTGTAPSTPSGTVPPSTPSDGTASTPPASSPAPSSGPATPAATTPAASFFSPPQSPAAPPQTPATPPPSPAGQVSPPPPHQPQPPLPAQPGTWPGVAPVQWHTPGQQHQSNQPVVGWASTNPAMPAPEPPAVESFLNSAAASSSAEKTQPAFSHTPGTPFSTDRPTTAPSPADDRPTAVFGAIPANGNQPEPRRLWEDDAKPRRGKPTWLFLSLAVLVVLALVVGGIWFLGTKKDSNDSATPPPAASSAPNTQPASLEDKLPTLPGTPNPENSTMALDKAVQAKAVSDADANLMRAAGADQLVYHAYAGTDGGTTLIAVPTPSKAQAGQLVQGLRQNLVTGGFDSSPLGPAATDLLYTGSSPAGRVLAFWYTSGGVSVGIGVSGPVDQDPAALRSRMEEIRAKVAAALPAS
ncbi:hypothetical protein [Amycolatopsis echigonensis]|uniref:Uncharacterized protein n=1 Tax=Amycolatopsis echigonensis TaxID=2576905 RepID=A0A8E1T1V5_9PSEU|nr:hypothetical protein [Amycolatopsis echigonensis]MBB2497942.1 hypothetical protein [Amycolatopsis echigonensis]